MLINFGLVLSAQENALHEACLDTLLFRQLQMDKKIAPSSDIKVFSQLFRYIKRESSATLPVPRNGGTTVSEIIVRDRGEKDYEANMHVKNYDEEFERLQYEGGSDVYPGEALIRNEIFEQCRDSLLEAFERQNKVGDARKAEMEDLVERLGQFSKDAHTKPLFFVDIKTKYNGNVRKYVKHLYKHSMMADYDRLTSFLRKPSMEAIQKDPGVQMSIALALYNQWIARVKQGDVSAKR